MGLSVPLECCPSCGELVESLNDETGWCNSCSGITSCINCGKSTTGTIRCNACKYLLWLEQNADEIERVMVVTGLKASRAKKIVAAQNRPNCLACGKPIHRGMKDRDLFCTKSLPCRKASVAYKYHKNVQRRSHSESLIRALTAAEIVRLTSHTN